MTKMIIHLNLETLEQAEEMEMEMVLVMDPEEMLIMEMDNCHRIVVLTATPLKVKWQTLQTAQAIQ